MPTDQEPDPEDTSEEQEPQAEETGAGAEETSQSEAKIPEAFQKQADSLIEGANEHQLDYLQSCISQARQKASQQGEFSTEGMPS